MNCDEKFIPKKHHRHYKSKCEHRSRIRDQCKKNIDSVKTKLVVQKENFKCIEKLNTTICNHKNSPQRSINENTSKDSKTNYDIKRTVPRCLRQLCVKHHGHNKKKRKKPKKILGQKEIQIQKEPKKLPPKQLESDYEDISNKSLERYLEIPTSYKNVRKHCKEHQESKLDTLIKRTKERERILVEQSRSINPWNTSTPYSDVSSNENLKTCNEIDVSLHSRSTLVLEPKDLRYSTSIEDFYPIKTELLYSPSLQKDYLKYPESNFELRLKSEPTMDITAYSAIQCPDSPKLFGFDDKWIKNEIKIEQNTDSPS